MDQPIRVLIVDDSEDDALLLADELRDSGYMVTYLRVDTPEAMDKALREQAWDLIVADYTMPRFSGPAALEVLHESGLDIPLILVSGTAGENTGVEMMRAGAQDFIVKHSLSRLAPAVARELTEATHRRRRREAEDTARTTAENYRRVFESAPVPTLIYDRDAIVRQVNSAFEQLFLLSAEDVIGRHVWETFGLPENAERTRDAIGRIFAGEVVKNAEYEDRRADGTPVYVLANLTPVYDEQGSVTMALAMLTDITDRKLAEQRQLAMDAHKREFYRRTILAATGGKLVVTEPEEIARVAGPAVRGWEIASLKDIELARDQIRVLATEFGMAEPRVPGFVGCAVEAMANVYKHAGGGTVTLHRGAEGLMLLATDTGPGIEALSLPDVALTKGYSTAASLGMGYKVMIEFADRVYLATSPEGTTVAIEMGLPAEQSPGDAMLAKLSSW